MSEETQTTTTETAPPPQPTEAERKLAENNAKLLGELKTERARSARLLELAGADPKTDPEKLAKTREADAQSARDRASKIEKAIIRGLLAKGKKLDEEMVDLIINGAHSAKSITVDDTGVNGVSEYLGKILGQIGTIEPPKEEPPKKDAPRLPRSGVEDNPNNLDAVMANLRQSVTTWPQLVKMGMEKKTEFEKRYPVRYAELESLFKGKFSPKRV